ncbi:unnamed protein product, partial [Mesorhabditis spiculigera]
MADKPQEKTFQYQNSLPKLGVPELDATLKKYLKSALVELPEKDRKETEKAVEEFRSSPLAGQLQQALLARKEQLDSWLDDWWYDAYCEIRGPLVPYLSLASIQPRAPRAIGSQICRAADSIYHMLKVWESLRKQTYPVMKSRGVIWDMNQNLCLFNAARVPQRPKDQMARYFKTEEQGACPSHIVILCRGNIWELDVMKNGALKSVDELYRAFEFVRNNSTKVRHSVATLTAEHRDTWADMRSHLQKLSSKNAENLLKIESSILRWY